MDLIQNSFVFKTLLFSEKPNPFHLLPKIPPACQPPIVLGGRFRARVDGTHHFESGMKCVTTCVCSTPNHRMEETEGGRDRRRRSRGSINGDMKGGEKKMRKERGESCWVCHCLASLWLGSYLWRTWCGCKKKKREKEWARKTYTERERWRGWGGLGNHHLGDQRPVCLFCLQPSSSVWKKGIG